MYKKVKVKKYILNWQGRIYDVLIPEIKENSLWFGVAESEDGNGILGTWEGLNSFLVAFNIASNNPYSIVYLPIKNFLIPDVKDVYRQVINGKETMLDIVITSTRSCLKRHDWKKIRSKIQHSKYDVVEIYCHFEKSKKLDYYETNRMINGALNDIVASTFFIVYPKEYLKHCSNEIYEWLQMIAKKENYTLEYKEKSDWFVFHDFYSDVWTFVFSKCFSNSTNFMCGFYLDCWDVHVMEKLLGRKINLLTRQEVKKVGE